MAFQCVFKANGVRWRYYTDKKYGAKLHTYITEDPRYPDIRSDKRLRPKQFAEELKRYTEDSSCQKSS